MTSSAANGSGGGDAGAGRRRRVRLTAALAAGAVAFMVGATAASPRLYDLFCRVTGLGGTTQRAEAAPVATDAAPTAAVTVYFDAATQPDLPWRFRPVRRSVEVTPGAEELAFYEAENLAAEPVVGRAIYNVTPHKAGAYFAKIACFCFDQQVLDAGQSVSMPVSFFVDPAMLEDPATREVRQITLSYTFFIDAEATAALRERRAGERTAPAPPPARG